MSELLMESLCWEAAELLAQTPEKILRQKERSGGRRQDCG